MNIFAATKTQQGKTANEDAFLIEHAPVPFAVLCDGAGNVQQTAKCPLALFKKFVGEATNEQLLDHNAWIEWVKLLDSSLFGGNQSTFVAVAIINSFAIGACTGDSRAYLLKPDGNLRILTDGATKSRLGSGQAEAFPIRQKLDSRDILMLLSDGAWSQLGLYDLRKAVQGTIGWHFSQVPIAILEAAGKFGRLDDMTAIAIRVRQ